MGALITGGAARERVGWAAVAAAVPALAAGQALVAYTFGPGTALALAAGLVVAAAVAVRPFAGICAAVLAVPLEYFDVRVGGGTTALSPGEAMLVFTAAVVAVRFVATGSVGFVHPAHVAFACLLLVLAIGLASAEDTSVVLRILVMWTSFLVLSLRIANSTEAERRALLACLAVAGAVVGGLALNGMAEQELVAGGTVVEGRATAGFAHPNVLAAFMVMAIPAALVMTARGPAWLRLAMAVAAALGVAGLVATLSRGAIVGTLTALAILLAWPGFRRAVLVAAIGLAVLVAFNADAITSSRQVEVISTRLGTITSERETTTNPRIRLWEGTPELIAHHPFVGVGAGNFALASPAVGLRDVGGLPFEHAHSIVLTVAVELGLVGLAVLLWLFAAVGRGIVRIFRARAGPSFPEALGACAALAGVFAHGLTDYPLRTNVIMAVVLLLIGLVVAYERDRCGLRAP